MKRGQLDLRPVVAARRRKRADTVHLPFMLGAGMMAAALNSYTAAKPPRSTRRERPHRAFGEAVHYLRVADAARARPLPWGRLAHVAPDICRFELEPLPPACSKCLFKLELFCLVELQEACRPVLMWSGWACGRRGRQARGLHRKVCFHRRNAALDAKQPSRSCETSFLGATASKKKGGWAGGDRW